MSSLRNLESIHIGLFSDEPIRLEGLSCIFDQPPSQGRAQLVPLIGKLEQLLAHQVLEYLVLDLQSSSVNMETLARARRARPSLKLIVIGPEGDDELILQAITAGARAWLGLTASPEMVRMAIEVVTGGSIWAPRRLLSDRLLKTPDPSISRTNPHLTDREKQVLDHILQARSNREIATELRCSEMVIRKRSAADSRGSENN